MDKGEGFILVQFLVDVNANIEVNLITIKYRLREIFCIERWS
jgi:hypothetical protein